MIRPMNHVTRLFVYCPLQSLNPNGRKPMDPLVVATVGSAAVAAADAVDQQERAARGRVDASQEDDQGPHREVHGGRKRC